MLVQGTLALYFEKWRSQEGSAIKTLPIDLGKKKFFVYFPFVTNITTFNIMLNQIPNI